METDKNDSTCAVRSIKSLSMECPSLLEEPYSCYGYSVADDHKKAECLVTIKEEGYEEFFVKYNTIKLDTFGATKSISKTGIAPNDINITLDLSDDNDFLNFRSKKESVEQDNAIENHFVTSVDRGKKYCYVNNKNFKRNNITKYTTLHGEERYKCNICFEHVKTRKVILKHMKLHFEKRYQGLIGARMFQRKDTHTNEVNYKCNVCTKSFVRIFNLRRHLKMHRNYKCEICNKYFITKQALSRHVKTHTRERSYECETCNKCFTRKEHLSRHFETHNTERNYKCDICNKCFTTKQALSQHLKTHTRERNSKCDICNKCFTTRDWLLKHIKTHTRDRNYTCETCNKCFATKQHLSRHIETHNTEKNYKCDICNKCLKTKQILSQHFKTHTRESSCKCEICKKCFTTRNWLLKHVKTHTKERHYKCEICNKCFATKQHLSRHFETHNTERNYKCETCNKCFTTKVSLSKHIKTHTSQRNYNCIKGNLLVEHIRTQTEESGKEERLQNCPYIVPMITTEEIIETNNPFIEKEIGIILKKDTAEKRLSTSTNESIDTAIKERDAKSTNVLNLRQTLHSEIVIKEEQLMATPFLKDT